MVSHEGLTEGLPVCHAKINGAGWIVDLIIRYRAHKKWYSSWNIVKYSKEEKTKYELEYKAVKNILQDELLVNIGDPKDMLCGESFKRIASDHGCRIMADLFEPEDQEGFQKVHLGLCTLILVLNSQKRKINVEALRQLGIETLLEVSKTFPWAIVSQTVHRICAHGWEKVAWNGDLGLGSNSEEGLESLNKFIRQIRSRRSRTNSTENNFRDTFNHLWRKSSPKIVALEREKGRRKKPLLVQQELEAFIEKYFLEDI